MGKFFVYVIQNITNNKIYVGQTKNLKRRWKSHRDGANGRRNLPLYTSMRKYGFDQFTMIEIESFDNLEDCNDAEGFWIQFFQSRNRQIGYNIAYGGNNHAHTPETKAKLSAIRTGTKASPKTKKKMSDTRQGKDNPMFGRKHSKTAKKAVSDANKGRLVGEKNPFYGKTHTEEVRALISEANSGENHNMFGKHHTEEFKLKLSKMNAGKTNKEKAEEALQKREAAKAKHR